MSFDTSRRRRPLHRQDRVRPFRLAVGRVDPNSGKVPNLLLLQVTAHLVVNSAGAVPLVEERLGVTWTVRNDRCLAGARHTHIHQTPVAQVRLRQRPLQYLDCRRLEVNSFHELLQRPLLDFVHVIFGVEGVALALPPAEDLDRVIQPLYLALELGVLAVCALQRRDRLVAWRREKVFF